MFFKCKCAEALAVFIGYGHRVLILTLFQVLSLTVPLLTVVKWSAPMKESDKLCG